MLSLYSQLLYNLENIYIYSMAVIKLKSQASSKGDKIRNLPIPIRLD